jgi:hypothetical protein
MNTNGRRTTVESVDVEIDVSDILLISTITRTRLLFLVCYQET